MYAYPELELVSKHDSNIALQPDTTRRGDTINIVRPTVRLEAKDGVNLYEASYRGEYGRFHSQTTDNYNNHELNGSGNLTFDARNNLKLGLKYQDRVDPRGTLNLAATPTPNEYHQTSMNGLYTYGAEDAQGKVEAQGGYSSKRYINNTATTAALDLKQTDYGGTFLYRVMPKTYATFNVKQSVYDYVQSTSTLDSTNTFVLVGVRWEATAATSGKFAIGNATKRFDSAGRNAGRQNFSGTSWEGGINWKPVSYSSVDLNLQRVPNDSTGLGNVTLNQTQQVNWTHAWTSQVSSTVMGSYATDDFKAAPIATAGGADRRDITKSAGLRLTYSIQRWLKVGAEYTYKTRDSNDNTADYKDNLFMLMVSGTL